MLRHSKSLSFYGFKLCYEQLFMLTLICLLICLFVIASSAQVSVLIMNVAELELTAVQLSQFSCSPNADGTFVK